MALAEDPEEAYELPGKSYNFLLVFNVCGSQHFVRIAHMYL